MSALIVGPLAVALLCIGWLAVQALWRRAFGLARETDVLEGRCGCAGACGSQACQDRDPAGEKRQYRPSPKEKRHA